MKRKSRKTYYLFLLCFMAVIISSPSKSMCILIESGDERFGDSWGSSVIRKAFKEKEESKRLEILEGAIKEGRKSVFMDDFILWKADILMKIGDTDKAIETLKLLETDYADASQDYFPMLQVDEESLPLLCAPILPPKILFSDYLESAPIKTIDNARYALAEIYFAKKDYEKSKEYLWKIIEDNKNTYKKSETWFEPDKISGKSIPIHIGIQYPVFSYLQMLDHCLPRPEIRSYDLLSKIFFHQKRESDEADIVFEKAKKYPRRSLIYSEVIEIKSDNPYDEKNPIISRIWGLETDYYRYLRLSKRIGKGDEAVKKLQQLKLEEKAEDLKKAIDEAIKKFNESK